MPPKKPEINAQIAIFVDVDSQGVCRHWIFTNGTQTQPTFVRYKKYQLTIAIKIAAYATRASA